MHIGGVICVILVTLLCSHVHSQVATNGVDHSHEETKDCPAPTVINTCSNASECETKLLFMENQQNLLESKFLALQAMYEETKTSQEACIQEAPPPIVISEKGSESMPNGTYAKDCTELYKYGVRTSGIHYIKPTGVAQPFPVFCEMAYEGWTLIMRRYDGSVSFLRSWEDYKRGFGSVKLEHYLGNERIHQLTTQPGRSYKLHIDMTFWVSGLSYYAEYNTFSVGNESTQYQLTASGYGGNVGFDGMTHHSGHKFSTYDRDNDVTPYVNCAASFKGGWWYSKCHYVNPTGIHKLRCNHDCIGWKHTPVKKIRFKVKAV